MITVDMVAVVTEVQRLITDPPRRPRADVYTEAIANVVGCEPIAVPRELRDAVKFFAFGAFNGASAATLRHFYPEVTDAEVEALRAKHRETFS